MYPTSRKMYTSPIVCLFGTENVFLFWSRLWGKKMNKTNQLNLNKSWTYILSLPFYFQTALDFSRYQRYVNGREYSIAMSLERLTFFLFILKAVVYGPSACTTHVNCVYPLRAKKQSSHLTPSGHEILEKLDKIVSKTVFQLIRSNSICMVSIWLLFVLPINCWELI